MKRYKLFLKEDLTKNINDIIENKVNSIVTKSGTNSHKKKYFSDVMKTIRKYQLASLMLKLVVGLTHFSMMGKL